jgi:hypothetical protein
VGHCIAPFAAVAARVLTASHRDAVLTLDQPGLGLWL